MRQPSLLMGSLPPGSLPPVVSMPILLCSPPQDLGVRHIDEAPLKLYDPFVLQLPKGPGDRLPVGPHHRPQLMVGVVGGYLQAVIASYHPLALQEQQEQTCQAAGNTLEGDVLQAGLVAP